MEFITVNITLIWQISKKTILQNPETLNFLPNYVQTDQLLQRLLDEDVVGNSVNLKMK